MFRYLGVERALQFMYSNPTLEQLLILRDHPPPLDANGEPVVRNLYESKAWRTRVVDSGFSRENNGRNIVLSFSTDGFNPFTHSNHSIWPLSLYVLNLPEAIRYAPSSAIVVGIVPGKSKPRTMQAYLQHLVNELVRLYQHGIMLTDSNGAQHHVRVMLLHTVADYPAHCMVNCQTGHSSYQGCIKCTVKVVLALHLMITAPRSLLTFMFNASPSMRLLSL